MDTSASSTQGGERSSCASRIALLPAIIVCVSCLGLANCASPGEPVERKAPIPASITDLAAEQSGNAVILTCTVPRETIEHSALAETPAVEIYRAIHPVATPASSANPVSVALLVTIPGILVTNYTQENHFRYVDSLTAGDFLPNHQQSMATYVIRTSASPKKESADSNRIELAIYPAPVPIDDLHADATESAIHLVWSAPQTTLTGDAPQIASYYVYRANAQTPATAAATSTLISPNANAATNETAAAAAGESVAPSSGAPLLTSPLAEIGTSGSLEYLDTDVQKDKTYVYSVRSAIQAPGKLLQSSDSNLAVITLRDVFPPSIPTGLIATPVPAEDGSAAHVDLSWAINPETDLAGYNVYRSEQAGGSGTRLNSQLLPTPAFSDMNAMPGQSYYYRVTAVDRTGNESAASAAVEARLNSAAGSQVSP
jgi:fibronectin type 3 domain-containing protein